MTKLKTVSQLAAQMQLNIETFTKIAHDAGLSFPSSLTEVSDAEEMLLLRQNLLQTLAEFDAKKRLPFPRCRFANQAEYEKNYLRNKILLLLPYYDDKPFLLIGQYQPDLIFPNPGYITFTQLAPYYPDITMPELCPSFSFNLKTIRKRFNMHGWCAAKKVFLLCRLSALKKDALVRGNLELIRNVKPGPILVDSLKNNIYIKGMFDKSFNFSLLEKLCGLPLKTDAILRRGQLELAKLLLASADGSDNLEDIASKLAPYENNVRHTKIIALAEKFTKPIIVTGKYQAPTQEQAQIAPGEVIFTDIRPFSKNAKIDLLATSVSFPQDLVSQYIFLTALDDQKSFFLICTLATIMKDGKEYGQLLLTEELGLRPILRSWELYQLEQVASTAYVGLEDIQALEL